MKYFYYHKSFLDYEFKMSDQSPFYTILNCFRYFFYQLLWCKLQELHVRMHALQMYLLIQFQLFICHRYEKRIRFAWYNDELWI